MSTELPDEFLRLIRDQDGVVSASQAASAGISVKAIRYQVHAGRWQFMRRGVYAAFSGKPTRGADLWAAVLRAGPEAVLSHQAAAELWGLFDGPSPVIHVTVPHGSNPGRRGHIAGVVIHQSRSLRQARHPALTPPRTRTEETVLDLVDSARGFDEAYAWICRAIGRRRTTAVRLSAALDARTRIQWRRDVELALGYAAGGALSVLELRYVRGVESATGGTRPARA